MRKTIEIFEKLTSRCNLGGIMQIKKN